jgi:hypothetical protein
MILFPCGDTDAVRTGSVPFCLTVDMTNLGRLSKRRRESFLQFDPLFKVGSQA